MSNPITPPSDSTPGAPSSRPEQPLNLNKFATPLPASAPDEGLAALGAAADDGQGQTVFIKRAAVEVAAGTPESESGAPVEAMLGLITYCYVRGVFSSKEIAERLRQDPELRERLGRWLPDEAAVKAFRRRHAAEIEDVLETVYRAFPPGEGKSAGAPAVGATELVRREAVERLHDAAWEDTMRSHLH